MADAKTPNKKLQEPVTAPDKKEKAIQAAIFHILAYRGASQDPAKVKVNTLDNYAAREYALVRQDFVRCTGK